MKHVKKALAAVGAVMALTGQAQEVLPVYPTEPPGAAAGYAQFGNEMHNFCHASQPFDGINGPTWGCVYHDDRPDPGVYTSNSGFEQE